MPTFQSAYRQFHSTETALIKIFNDLLLAADQGQVSALCLLDLASAFDTVDHTLLLTRLRRSFGVQGGCLAHGLRRIYQVEATACMVINGVASHVIHVMCSVLQGSVLGPLLFILYMADLADIAAHYKLTLHAFADDNQLYIHCKPENVQSAFNNVLLLLSSGWPPADSDLTWIRPN